MMLGTVAMLGCQKSRDAMPGTAETPPTTCRDAGNRSKNIRRSRVDHPQHRQQEKRVARTFATEEKSSRQENLKEMKNLDGVSSDQWLSEYRNSIGSAKDIHNTIFCTLCHDQLRVCDICNPTQTHE
jgi:hypothetical protein